MLQFLAEGTDILRMLGFGPSDTSGQLIFFDFEVAGELAQPSLSMLEGSDEGLRIEWLIATGCTCRAANGGSAIRQVLDEFFDNEITVGEILEGEVGAFGEDGTGGD